MATPGNDQRDLLNFFYQSFASDIALLSDRDLAGTYVGQGEPRPIFDLTGAALFADYTIVSRHGDPVGIVRSASGRPDVPLIDSIMIGRQWFDADAAEASAKAATQAKKIGPILGIRLVCYGYPYIGVLVTCNSISGTHSLLYDASTGDIVREWGGKLSLDRDANLVTAPEGRPFYSIMSEMSQGSSAATAATRQWAALRSAFALGSRSLRGSGVRFGIRGAMLPALLCSQETAVFCAVATAEMILAFVGIESSQDHIAKTMKTGFDGTTNDNFMAGISSISDSTLIPNLTTLPSFADFILAVDSALPSKSGIPGHARLLRGWREYGFYDLNGNVVAKEQFLIINDPYPIGSGQLVLENLVKPIEPYYTNLVSVTKKS